MSDPADDRRRLEAFFRDELRLATAEAPSFDELQAYVEGRLDPEARLLLEERLAADPALRREVEALRDVRDQMRRAPAVATRPRPLALAGLAAAAALLGVVLWLRPAVPKGPELSRSQPSPTAAPVATLKDGEARIALALDGSVLGLPRLDAASRDAIAAALRGDLHAPQGLEALQPGPRALLGGQGGGSSLAPVSPLGTKVSADRPVFRWTPHPGARSYEVAVFSQDLRKRAGSGPLTSTQWIPDRPLARGQTYLWQVAAALTDGRRVTAPAPPAPEARFEVVDAAVLDEIERRRAGAPGSHLLATVVLVQAGLLDEADAELRALGADNPGAPQVARLVKSFQELRRLH